MIQTLSQDTNQNLLRFWLIEAIPGDKFEGLGGNKLGRMMMAKAKTRQMTKI